MRGSANVLLVIFLTLSFVVTALFTSSLTIQGGEAVNRHATIQMDYHTVSTALDAATIYLKTALRYAVYQALYEADLEEKIWYNNGKASFLDGFQNKIKFLVDGVLVKYTRDPYTFLEANYLVVLPEYNSTVALENNTLKVSAEPNNRLKIEVTRPKQDIILEKTVKLEESFDYKPLFAANKFLEGVNGTDFINSTVGTYFNNTWKTHGEERLDGCENKNKDIENIEIFNKQNNKKFNTTADAEKLIVAELDQKINNITSGDLEVAFKLTSNTTITITANCAVNKEDLCDQQNPRYTYTKTCDFAYNYKIDTDVIIEDQQSYPIKPVDSKAITFSPQKITFQYKIEGEHK